MKSKAVMIRAHGGPEVLEVVEVDVKDPGPDEVRIRQHAIGLNFIDIYYRTGLYANALPHGLGFEGAGVVEAVGSNVKFLKAGDRVAYPQGPIGAYSEMRTMPVATVVKLPKKISFDEAAAVMLKGLTVQYLFRQTYRLQGTETIVFHAAAGGVGLIACQWARALGVKTDRHGEFTRKGGTREEVRRVGNDRLHEGELRRARAGADEGRESAGGLRQRGQGHVGRFARLHPAARADGELRQRVGPGDRREHRHPCGQGVAVRDAADAGDAHRAALAARSVVRGTVRHDGAAARSRSTSSSVTHWRTPPGRRPTWPRARRSARR